MNSALETRQPVALPPHAFLALKRELRDVRTLTVPLATFVALRALGWSSAKAYRSIRPHVKDSSAKVLGPRWNRRLARAIRAVKGNPRLLEDLIVVTGTIDIATASDPQVSTRDRLTAMDQIARRNGMYGDSVNVAVFTGLEAGPGALLDEPCDDAVIETEAGEPT